MNFGGTSKINVGKYNPWEEKMQNSDIVFSKEQGCPKLKANHRAAKITALKTDCFASSPAVWLPSYMNPRNLLNCSECGKNTYDYYIFLPGALWD